MQIVDGNILYIADSSNNRVVILKPGSTNATAILGSFGTALNQFKNPTDIFVTSTSIFILDASNSRVQMWPKNGSSGITVAGTTNTPGSSASLINLGYCYGIYVDWKGQLYVVDKTNNRVLRFPPGSTSGTSGVMVAGNGAAGSGPSQLNGPSKVFVDNDLSMYIADAGNQRIQKWTYGACSGVTVAGNGTLGMKNSQLNYPIHVIVDDNGFMFITDRNYHRVLRWLVGSPSGECIAGCSGIAGTRADQLNYPHAALFDNNGLLYVVDKANSRVQKFSLFSTSSEYSTFSDATVGVLEIVNAFCLFSTTGSIAHGTMDAVSDHRRRIIDGCSRKWIFGAVSQPGLADCRQQHALHRRQRQSSYFSYAAELDQCNSHHRLRPRNGFEPISRTH